MKHESFRLSRKKTREVKWATKVLLEDSFRDLNNLLDGKSLSLQVTEIIIKLQIRMKVYKEFFNDTFNIGK